MNLTHHTEILPSAHPLEGSQRDAGHQAALEELHEAKHAYMDTRPESPRMRRRYTEAAAALQTYTKDHDK